MADRKPFLVESFSLGDLANVLFTNKVYLSKTINYYSGKNFRSYINYYRVMYAMELFRKNKSLTVSELGALAGFHSGTTFNQAFKAVMQESPSTLQGRDAGVSEYLVREVAEEKPRIPQVEPVRQGKTQAGFFEPAFSYDWMGVGCPEDSAPLRPLPTSPASPQSGNLYPSGPSPYTCPGVDKPPDTPYPSKKY